RRAQFVAHRAEEFRFRTVGGFGRFLGGAQLVLDALALGDLLDHAFVIEELAVIAAHFAAAFRYPDDAAVAAIDLRFESRDDAALAHLLDESIAARRIDIE